MTLSRFYELLEEEFGTGFSKVVLNDTRLTNLKDLTPAQLIAQGHDTKDLWFEICRAMEVPKERWHGKPVTKRHAE